jgi:hypothetical protein
MATMLLIDVDKKVRNCERGYKLSHFADVGSSSPHPPKSHDLHLTTPHPRVRAMRAEKSTDSGGGSRVRHISTNIKVTQRG